MKNIVEILKGLGVEVPADKQSDLNKDVAENYKTIAEHNKAIGKVESERDNYKSQYETADEALKGFEGVDPDKIQEELQKYKEDKEAAEKALKIGLAERDFNDALSVAMKEYQFSSKAAQNSVADEVRQAGLKCIGGKILGLSDLITVIKGRDPNAFVDEEAKQAKAGAAQFTTKINSGSEKDFLSLTKEEFAKMGISERTELKETDPDTYNKFKRG